MVNFSGNRGGIMCKNEEVKLAYCAGVLDGDGSFSIMKKKGDKEGYSPLYYPVIQIANWSKELIDFFYENFKGSIFTRKAHLSKDGHHRKDSHQWKLEKSTMCLPFIEKLIPHLVIKKERAEFLRKFIFNNPRAGRIKLSEEVLQKKEVDYIKMRSFNDSRVSHETFSRKGRKDSEDPLFWAYVAGLLDTDGSFSIAKDTGDKKMINPKYRPSILLSMTDIKGINFIVENCANGSVFALKGRTMSNSMVYRFGIYTRDQAIPFLEKCIPHLRLKKRQAIKMLEFCNNYNPTRYNRAGVEEQELTFREECYEYIKQLNKYGVYKPTLIDLEA